MADSGRIKGDLKEEKVRLEIDHLRDLIRCEEFKFSQFSIYMIGLLALLVSIFIPVIIKFNDIWVILLSSVVLIILFFLTYNTFKPNNGRNIENYYHKLNELHKKLRWLKEDC